MKGIKFEKDQIQAVYDEVARRMQQFYTDEYTEREAEEEHRAMRQGVYSVLSSLAINWPEVRYWIDEIEDNEAHRLGV
nr:MAG TPA: hypothetical protein [Caudoviricetes sp.]